MNRIRFPSTVPPLGRLSVAVTVWLPRPKFGAVTFVSVSEFWWNGPVVFTCSPE
jgi:hypothetical protein